MSAAILIGLAIFAYSSGMFGKSGSPASEGPKVLHVAASFYPMYYFSSRIGGQYVATDNITPADAEPHDYEPTARQIVGIEKSDILVLNGGGVEAWGDKITSEINNGRPALVVAGNGVATRQIIEEGKSAIDPHVWLDPLLAEKEAANIAAAFSAADPAHASAYATNAEALRKDLEALDKAYTKGLASCKQRNFITSHAAFGYLAERYHLTQVAVAGISPDEEPSPRKLAELTDLVKREHIGYIFFESLVSTRLSDTLAAETGAKPLVLDPLEGISQTDAATGKDYFTQMTMNLVNLELALECTPSR